MKKVTISENLKYKTAGKLRVFNIVQKEAWGLCLLETVAKYFRKL